MVNLQEICNSLAKSDLFLRSKCSNGTYHSFNLLERAFCHLKIRRPHHGFDSESKKDGELRNQVPMEGFESKERWNEILDVCLISSQFSIFGQNIEDK